MSTHAHQPILLVVVGPAGAGKTTLAHLLQRRYPDVLSFSVSHATRPVRAGEADGRDYHFVGESTFKQMIEAGELAEWAEVHGNLYGTSRGEIARHAEAGRDILLDVDIQGAHSLARAYPEGVVPVFVLPPSWATLTARLEARRSETPETLARRLRTARHELEQLEASRLPWRLVINDVMEQAVADLEMIWQAARMLTSRRGRLVESFLAACRADPRASSA